MNHTDGQRGGETHYEGGRKKKKEDFFFKKRINQQLRDEGICRFFFTQGVGNAGRARRNK